MKFALKLLLMIIGGFIALLLMSILGIMLFFNPNDYKPQITQLVRDYTGRDLQVAGEIQLSLYPWLGIQVDQISISNPENFQTSHFASAQKAVVRAKLLPLFSQQFEVDTVYFEGLNLNLVRQKDGKTNLDDLLQTPETNTEKKTAPHYQISGVEIHNAYITWEDQADNKTATLSELTLKISELKPKTPIQLDIITDLNTNYSPTPTQGHLEGKVILDLEKQIFQFNNMSLTTNIQQLPKNLQALKLTTQANLDLPNQTLTVENLVLETPHGKLETTAKSTNILSNINTVGTLDAQLEVSALLKAFKIQIPPLLKKKLTANTTQLRTQYQVSLTDVFLSNTALQVGKEKLTASKLNIDFKRGNLIIPALTLNTLGAKANMKQLKITRLFTKPGFQGQLKIETSNLRQFLKQLNQAVPKIKDKNALTKLTLTTNITGDTSQVKLDKLALQLDKTKIKGKIAVKIATQPSIGFNLEADKIDVDRYLPPASKNKKQASDTLQPLDIMRKLRINGKLQIGQLTVAKIKTAHILLNITAKDGKVKISSK